ncbi:MAG: glycosyltransferase [Clostridiales bacterium]|nr:glycosyltransferase [Clostridiales bacterium]
MQFLSVIPPVLVKVLDNINWVVVTIAGACMALPMIYWVLMIIPQKKYPEARVNHRFIVVTCARNERNVIGHLIDSIRAQNYPRELLDILVVAHNCKDDTAEVARKAGADYVLELNDPDPKHGRKGYALQLAFREILDNHPEYEGIMVMDADNLMNVDFVKEMNKAFDAGVKVGTGYRNSKNYDDNCIAGSNGMTFLRDCRANGHGRTRLHSTVPLAGTGFFIRREIAADMGGWNAFNLVEDFEYTLQLIDKKHRVQYVPKAEFFDEQPHGLKYSLVRQTRLGKGVFQLLWRYGPKMLFRFFTRFWLAYIDMFLYLLYPFVALLATFWFPAYYIFKGVLAFMAVDPTTCMNVFGRTNIFEINDLYGIGPVSMFKDGLYVMASDIDPVEKFIWNLTGNHTGWFYVLWSIGYQIIVYVIGLITIQNIVLLIVENKRVNYTKWYRALTMIILYPWYNLLVAVALAIGILTPKLTWRPTIHDRAMSLSDITGKSVKSATAAESTEIKTE